MCCGTLLHARGGARRLIAIFVCAKLPSFALITAATRCTGVHIAVSLRSMILSHALASSPDVRVRRTIVSDSRGV